MFDSDKIWATSHTRAVRRQQRRYSMAVAVLNVYLRMSRHRRQRCIKQRKPFKETGRTRKQRGVVMYELQKLKRLNRMPYEREQSKMKAARLAELGAECAKLMAELKSTDNVAEVRKAIHAVHLKHVAVECMM